MASSESDTAPVADLLTFGPPADGSMRAPAQWPDYPGRFGLTGAHSDELARMVQDPDLNAGDPDTPDVWAPVHAWRTLGQLGATAAAESLCRVCLDNPFDDWVGEELPEVFALLGSETLPVVAHALGQQAEARYGRVTLVQAVVRIGTSEPAARDRCVTILRDQLAHHADQDSALNGFLIKGLADLGATATMDTVRAAFAADSVDTMVLGDVEDAEIEFGLRSERETPRPENPWTTRLRKSAFKALKGEPGMQRDSRRDQPASSGAGFPFDAIGDLSDGAAPPTGGAPQARTSRKVGRNEPCPCGSGKKAKQCCGAG